MDDEQTSAEAPPAPAIHDSDLIYLAIRRLERVAAKMLALEYDDELQQHLTRTGELLEWATWNIANHSTTETE